MLIEILDSLLVPNFVLPLCKIEIGVALIVADLSIKGPPTLQDAKIDTS